jgi:uncharacterized protein Usg
MGDRQFLAQLKGYSLTTAEILYHLPDYPALLQSFVWQDYDVAPKYPKLRQFISFWNGNLDGKVSRVRVSHKELIDPAEFRFYDGKLILQ